MKYATSAAATFALLSTASAHMFMSSPKPIQGNAIKNPLDPSGSDFPCHGVSPPGAGGVSMAVGSKQSLIFDSGLDSSGKDTHANTAVHGGGSCQISITYETDAAKLKDPNSWRVLYSIEGGCPTNSKGNLADSYQGPNGGYSGAWQCSDPATNGYDCVNSFEFTIPEGVKSGQATLAWTWFNTIGNREMYMNCAAVNIQGGASDASALESFPPMFVANLASVGGGQCRTTEMTNVGFPNPGQNVLRKSATSNMRVASATDYPVKTPSGCPAGSYATAPAPVPSSSSAAAPVPSSSSAAAPSSSAPATTSVAAPAPPASSPSTTLQTSAAPVPGTSAPAATPTGLASTTSIRKRPVATKTTKKKGPAKTKPTKAAATGTGSSAVSLPMPSATTGSCAAGSVSCIGVNSVVCVDDNHFGICDYNGCAISQAVAPGTMCSQGAITWAKSKNKRHLARHVHGKHAF
ncbi:hypothetical protein CAC42_256 [Sphaceloma murrayae]|uniref:Lytic polysaccharide monooxygenase n=1 Tax=Sphaceloma murrayae TaxID=2082308 RepID=A0A2K1QNF1_9PEZI|nr:hypothetical protein CAC42_256 [Sphaceloma murrayae]